MQLGRQPRIQTEDAENDDGLLTPWWSITMTASWSQMPSWV